jgi:lipoprotein-releasing system permease protein
VPFEWFVALRYLREGRMQTALILLGVSVGVAVIIFLAALIDGLQENLIDKTLGYQAHIVVHRPEDAPRVLSGADGEALAVILEKPAQRLRSIDQWQQVMADLERVPGVSAVSPAVSGAAFANRGTASRSINLKGVDPVRFNRIVNVSGRIRHGRFRLSGAEVVIGVDLANDLGASVGDKIRILTSGDRSDVFTVTGIFDLQNKEANERWALVSLPSAQTLCNVIGGVTAIEAKVSDIFQAEEIAQRIQEQTGLVAESWMVLNAQLLVGLRSQNSSRYMIQIFVIIAVALGIASVLVVWVVQKNREIGILRAVGTSKQLIMRIFLIQGALLGLGGWAMGAILGTGLSHFFRSLARNPDGSPTFPVDLNFRLFLTTALLAILTGLLASVAPARRAAALDPAAVIHHV